MEKEQLEERKAKLLEALSLIEDECERCNNEKDFCESCIIPNLFKNDRCPFDTEPYLWRIYY